MESLGRFQRVLNVLSREKIEGPPRDFLKARQNGKKPKGLQGLRDFGLWSGQKTNPFFYVCLFLQRFETSKSLIRNPKR